MNCLNRDHFDKSHVKKGFKEIGWDYAKIVDQKDDIYLTSPWVSENNGRPNYPEADGEWMVWKKDIALVEFLKREDAIWFFNHLVNDN